MLRTLWAAWILAAVTTALGAAAYHVSEQRQQVPLRLVAGESVVLRIHRVLRDELWIAVALSGLDAEACVRQGRFEGKTGHVLLEPTEPGDPLLLQASDSSQRTVYRALPASECNPSIGNATRRLIPYPDPKDPNQILWPPSLGSWTSQLVRLHPGTTDISIVVQEVAPSLAGRTAVLEMEPPISLKATHASHKTLDAVFFWWPMYAVALVVLAIALALRSRRR
jgi:hypothetical protein